MAGGLEALPTDSVLLILYHYLPSKGAAIAAVVLYAIISLAVTAVTCTTRTYYMLTVAVTGFLELAGELAGCLVGELAEREAVERHTSCESFQLARKKVRVVEEPSFTHNTQTLTLPHPCAYTHLSHTRRIPTAAGWSIRLAILFHPTLNLYIVHRALLIISPVLLANVEYITLSRLIQLSTPAVDASTGSANHDSTAGSATPPVARMSAPVSRFAKGVKWGFTLSDIFCLLLQSTGGAMYANADSAALGRLLLLIGLGAQLGFFTIFFFLVVYVHFVSSLVLGATGHSGQCLRACMRPLCCCSCATASESQSSARALTAR